MYFQLKKNMYFEKNLKQTRSLRMRFFEHSRPLATGKTERMVSLCFNKTKYTK
jgi:hypothetical protein